VFLGGKLGLFFAGGCVRPLPQTGV
jgi:hypothetical protein